MTQDEIMELARQAHISLVLPASERALVTFAKLVAQAEREECAVACEKELEYWGWHIVFDSAKLIRARGEA
jgi:hypothetical protein